MTKNGHTTHTSAGLAWWPVRFAVFVVACMVPCRSASAAGPAYLADMPTPAQVEAKIYGIDSDDTAVRQAEAFLQLCMVVRSLSQGGEFGNKMTPEETAQCALYGQVSSAIAKAKGSGMPPYGPKSWTIRSQRYHNDEFREEVLSEFPRVKAAYDGRPGAAPSSPGALFAMVGGVGLLLGVGGIVLLIFGLRLNKKQTAGGGGENVVVRTIEVAATNLVPRDPSVIVEHMCLGAKDHYHSYIAPVTTHHGYVSGGGTQTSSYIVFDFGWAVYNRTAMSIRFQVTIDQLDASGYVLSSRPVWKDIAPGEKHRIWAGLSARENHEFARKVLKEVGFGPTPADRRDTTRFTSSTAPNVSLFELFGLQRSPLKTSSKMDSTRNVGCLVIFVSLAMILAALVCGVVAWVVASFGLGSHR